MTNDNEHRIEDGRQREDGGPTDDGTAVPLTRRGALALGGAALGGTALSGVGLAQEGDDGDGMDDGDDESDDMDDDGDDGDDMDDGARSYRVTVANLTRGQPFTPPAVALHQPSVEVFSVGEPANTPTQEIAENGNLQPLVDLIESTDAIRAAAVGDAPLVPDDDPGDTGNPYYTSLELSADASATHLTFISMLIATNDGIVGLDTVPLPEAVNASRTYYANGYDVGTEQNTEQFSDMVPPAQTLILGEGSGGTGESNPDIAEDGVITPHPGIEGGVDLDPSVYGWREPAALVQVERLPGGDDGDESDDGQTEYETELSGENEVPPVETEASGEATMTLNEAGDELVYEIRVEDIEGVVAAHVHCGDSDENGPIGVTLFSGGPVSPEGVLADGTVTAPDSDNNCGWATLDDVVAAIEDGDAYVNVHTQANPAGEIRGQL